MTLTWQRDVSPADWLTASAASARQLITFGPAGFADAARLRFVPDPSYPGQREGDIDNDDIPDSEGALLRGVLDVLARHTTTPEDCFFCLWDGWGDLDGGTRMRHWDPVTRTVTRGPKTAPAFVREVLEGPKVSIPHRDYHLFRGPIAEFGDWGAADYLPGLPRTDPPNPGFIWPADHAWCLADDIDPHWAGIGASVAAIDELIAAGGLDIVRADPFARQPAYAFD